VFPTSHNWNKGRGVAGRKGTTEEGIERREEDGRRMGVASLLLRCEGDGAAFTRLPITGAANV